VERAAAAAATSLAWYRSAHGLRSEIEIHTVLHWLRPRADMRVLDVGCGAGRVTIAIAPRVGSVTAVDISSASVEALRRYVAQHGLTNVAASVSDMNALDVPPGHYDRALAVQSLQHVPGKALRRDAVGRVFRALRPGGCFVTVNYRWGGMIAADKEGTHGDGRYRFAFAPTEIARLLRDAGFRRVSVGGCVNVPSRMERLAAISPRLLVRLDALLSRASLSRRMGLYLIATGTA
jgi:SAM-dependent methyltransferase